MQLKFYLVLKGPDDELVIWKRPEYENYIKGAVGVGAGSAYKLITHFDPGESLINEYVTLPSLPVKSEDITDRTFSFDETLGLLIDFGNIILRNKSEKWDMSNDAAEWLSEELKTNKTK